MSTTTKTLWMLVVPICLVAGTILALRGGRYSPPHSDGSNKPRVVSLAPSVTEIVFAIGAGDCLVGVTDRCDYPPEAKHIQQVGGFGRPNVETLLAIAPDAVIAAGFERGDVAEVLQESGIRVLDVRIRNFEELFEAMRQIGGTVNRRREAEDFVAKVQAELATIATQHASAPRERLPRVFVEIWDSPLTTAGGSSFLDDVIARAGGINVARDIPLDYPRISPEKVIEWNPDVVVLAHAEQHGIARAKLSGRIGWSGIAAVRTGNVVHDIPGDLLLRPGPRLVDGVKALAQRLHKARSGSTPAIRNETCP